MEKLAPGDRAPAFTLLNPDGLHVSLSDFAGQKVILYFYPAAMTPGCTTQACDFSSANDAIATAGYTIIGISPDTPEKLARFREKYDLPFILLSDVERKTLTNYGAFGEKTLYGKTVQGVIRSTFAVSVDETGVGCIEQVWTNVKATGHVARLLRFLSD